MQWFLSLKGQTQAVHKYRHWPMNARDCSIRCSATPNTPQQSQQLQWCSNRHSNSSRCNNSRCSNMARVNSSSHPLLDGSTRRVDMPASMAFGSVAVCVFSTSVSLIQMLADISTRIRWRFLWIRKKRRKTSTLHVAMSCAKTSPQWFTLLMAC